jgi:hypothetical protein
MLAPVTVVQMAVVLSGVATVRPDRWRVRAP